MNTESRQVLISLLLEEISSSSSSSESDNEDVLFSVLAEHGIPRQKISNYESLVRLYSNEEFRENFRVSRSVCTQIIELFGNSNFYPKCRTHGGIPPNTADNHILSFLWFAGNKACLRDVAGRFGMCPKTLHLQVKRVMGFLLKIAPKLTYFPATAEAKQKLSDDFYKISGFPGVLGCIDGTYIPVRTPAHKIRSTYVNRHDQVSVTLQVICDSNRAFLDVFTGTPRKVHDARVYKMSFIYKDLPAICSGDHHLLGDSAYPLSEWLMTPFKDFGNLTPQQVAFNRKLSATRVRVENAIGHLKQRFRQLMYLDFHTVDKMTKFILSCCVLHNLCICNNDTDFDLDPAENSAHDEDFPQSIGQEAVIRRRGETKRDRLAIQMTA